LPFQNAVLEKQIASLLNEKFLCAN